MKKIKVLILGNIKEDNSQSMKIYGKFLKKIFPKAKLFEPSANKIYVKIFKNFIYPFIIPKGYDIYHIIDQSYSHLAYFIPKEKIVITCHDLIPLIFPEKISKKGLISFKYYISGMKRAKKIIADSTCTKEDIIKILRIEKDKIEVVQPICLNKKKFEITKKGMKRKYNLIDKTVLLSIGNCFYKNTLLILNALKELKKNYSSILLIKIGGFSKKEIIFIKENKLEKNVIVKQNLNQKQIEELYYLSDILVFPSIYEGFGIPPLEAMACGTPVITSNVASLPEVVGNAAIKINPYSLEELKKAIINILEDKKLREDLVKRGYENLKRFNERKIKNKLIKIYKSIVEENKKCAA